MKKILSILSITLISFGLKAQNPTFVPASFTAEDQVTLTVDVSGTGMAGATDAYIWIFSNVSGGGNDGLVNGSWTNSSDAAKMTPAGTNKWSFTFTGTILFGRPASQLKDFGFLVKKKDGSAQTPDYKPFAFDPLTFLPTMLRIFPAKVGAEDVVSANFDQSLGVTVAEQRMTPTSVTFTVFDNNDLQVGSPLTVPVSHIVSPAIWTGSFVPSLSFTPPAGKTLKKFRYKFNGTVLDVNGVPSTVSSSEAEVVFTNMK